ncbi:MAG TPA: maleylpyruvate isomerase family mycothiol-dependent enzyme, partial [Streptosporangiaceae bacterium]|nr:maleylpyruvate isomerase family mycothiol-dependent enzyme [Streptosporangiaceae bacterium]
MPDPGRVPPVPRPRPASAEGARILSLHPAAETLLAALRIQVRTGRLVRSGQLSLESPRPGWSVRDVMNHSIGVTLKFADFAAGGSDHPRTPPGDLVGRDHRLALRLAAAAAQAAWASADMARPCHLPFGTFPASLAAGINLFDVLAHTWDIAAVTGVALECADDLWQAGLEAARAVI